MAKIRLDLYLAEQGFFASREKARAAVMAGQVKINGLKAQKPGQPAPPDGSKIEIEAKLPFVSRGGLKLAKAISFFGLNLQGKTLLDAGASTGGFTDCALQNGAKRVIAVDVGYGQLDWSLRNDPRVRVLERTNIRYLTDLGEKIDFFTADLSFISLTKVLPNIQKLVEPKAEGVVLIKPQFEAGREKIGKKGVVRDPQVQVEVLEQIGAFVENEGWTLQGLTHSPIKGPEGNLEYLAYLNFVHPENKLNFAYQEIVRAAWAEIGG